MDWNFSNYYLWRNSFPECSGREQSPINIDTSPKVMEECSIMCQLNMKYKKSECRVNLNQQNVITVECTPGSFLLNTMMFLMNCLRCIFTLKYAYN